MIVIVGSNARNAGKTTLVCELIAASRGRRWVAVKISGHPHGPAPLPETPRKQKATELFLAAGAAEVHLLRDSVDGRAKLLALVAGGRHVIVESNRAVEWVKFDVYVFVLDGQAENPKQRERWHWERAAWVLPPRQNAPEALKAALR